MNRHELEVLLTTHPPHSVRAMPYPAVPNSRTVPAAQSRVHLPLSPKEQFQNQVTSLVKDNKRGHRRNRSISLNYNPYELRHTSSLRVQAQRSVSRSPARAGTPSLEHVEEEPDFVVEERDACSRESTTALVQGSKPTNDFVVFDDGNSDLDERCGDLQPFAPSRHAVDLDERPKTSRGSLQTDKHHDCGEQSPSKSRFLEGSMNTRSAGVSSSWAEHHSGCAAGNSDTEDSDATPKAARTLSSSSIDLQDFDPPTLTPGTLRRTLFGRKKSSDNQSTRSKHARSDQHTKPEYEEKKEKRKLRKSLPSWSLQSIGEKIRLFNTSSSSVNTNSGEMPPIPTTSKHVLDERKRKAEEIYARQFGTKKQKDNDGAVQPYTIYQAEPEKAVTVRRGDGYSDPDATIRARGRKSTRRPSLDPMDIAELARQDSVKSHDLRKRPTRRELEKENQQLRAMLRESQSTLLNSEAHEPCRTQADPARTTESTQSVPNIVLSSDVDVPPVPAMSPQRRPLRRVQNVRALKPVESSLNSLSSQTSKPVPSIRPTRAGKTYPSDSASSHSCHSLPCLSDSDEAIVEEGRPSETKRSTAACKKNEAINQPKLRGSKSKYDLRAFTTKDWLSTGPDKENENRDPEKRAAAASTVAAELVAGSKHAAQDNWKGWDDDVF